jgi:hypothetical protein
MLRFSYSGSEHYGKMSVWEVFGKYIGKIQFSSNPYQFFIILQPTEQEVVPLRI